MKTLEKQTFSFWKENKRSGFFQLTDKELIDKFKEWLPTKDKDWLENYNIRDCVFVFISEHLNSIGNIDNNFTEYIQMEELLNPIRRFYLGWE